LNKTSWIIFTIFTASVLGLLVFFADKSTINVSKIDVNAVQPGNNQNGNIADHILGKTDSKVTLIEYGDYQCSHCGSYNPTIATIVEEYKEQLRFVFRTYSLGYPSSKAAAAAVEAAGLQGKYWEMHNKIFEAQSDWSGLAGTKRNDYFNSLASNLKLDTKKFTTDMASKNVINKIAYDTALGKKAKVEGTPTFYLNGTDLDSKVWSDKTKLKDAINKELQKNGLTPPVLESE